MVGNLDNLVDIITEKKYIKETRQPRSARDSIIQSHLYLRSFSYHCIIYTVTSSNAYFPSFPKTLGLIIILLEFSVLVHVCERCACLFV